MASLLKKTQDMLRLKSEDAYGYGSVELAKFLYQEGADYFAVATL